MIETNIIKHKNVAIIGIGFRIPSGNNIESIKSPEKLYEGLKNGMDGVIKTSERWSDNFNNVGEIICPNAGLLPFEELKSFDPLFFGISPSDAPTIDPQQRLLLKCTWEALEDASIDPISIRGSNTSVFIGSSTTDYLHSNKNLESTSKNILNVSMSCIANRISYCFDFNGPSITLDTFCSSSLNAVSLGYQNIINGTSNVSIVGGVNLIFDNEYTKGFSHLNMLSKKQGKCKSFDESADGFVRSESVGVVVLKNLEDAIRDGNRIYCVISGASSNNDSSGNDDKLNFLSPSKQSQFNNIKLALKSTNGAVELKDIKYVETHGTGTPTGDPIETEAISMAFKERNKSTPILIGSIKSNIGHCEAASGIVSLIKCCLIYKNQQLLPNIHFKNPNPSIKFNEWNLKVVTEPIPFSTIKKKKNHDKVSIMINNFGVSGSNCCLILSEYKQNYKPINNNNESGTEKNHNHDKKILIPFSANSIKSLSDYQELFSNKLINDNHINSDNNFIQSIQSQINSKSTSLYQRSIICASNFNQFIEIIENNKQIKTSNSKISNMLSKRKNQNIVFIFPGQGSQYKEMGLKLYNHEITFKKTIDLIDEKLSQYYGYSILNKLKSINDVMDTTSIHHPMIAQPFMCMFSIALFELYKEWGVSPSFIIGHSLGEIPTAYCSGMIDLDTLCYIVYHRSIAQIETHRNGRMLSINISEDEYNSQFSKNYSQIEIACYNSPSSIVVAGNESLLNELSKELKEKGVFSVMLGSLSAFHTSSQSITQEYLLDLSFEQKQPDIPTFSTVTTNLFDDQTIFNQEYIYENIINPVKFSQTIDNLYTHIESNQLGQNIIFIEISPHPTLSYYLKQMIPPKMATNESISIYSTLHKKKDDIEEFQQIISNLYCQNGLNINFKCQLPILNQMLLLKGKKQQNNIELPRYQWDDQSYYTEDYLHENHMKIGPPIDHLGISNSDNSPFKSFKTLIDVKNSPFQYLKGHMVKGKYFFPGCGYIDNIIKLYSNQDFIISFIEFKLPLILIGGVNQQLQTNVYQTGKTEYRAQFHFKDRQSNGWVQTSNANFQVFNHGNDIPKKYNIQEIIDTKCNLAKVTKKELYQHIKSKTGLNYNGVFQGVSECYFGDNCSLSIVSLETQSDWPLSFLNLPILDSCLHGMIGLINDQCQLVFDKVYGFKYYSSNIPTTNDGTHKNLYVFSKLNSKFGDSYFASITAMLSDGTVIYDIDKTVCTSLTPVIDTSIIEYPNDELYFEYLQPKDSQISKPSNFKSTYQDHLNSYVTLNIPNDLNLIISTLFYSNIIKRCEILNFEIINSLSIDELVTKYCKPLKHERLFRFVFDTIKQSGILNPLPSLNQYDQSYFEFFDVLLKTTRVIPKLLFPTTTSIENENENEDTPQSLFENGTMDRVYSCTYIKKKNQLIAQIIKKTIKELIDKNVVLRIIEFGGGVCSLTIEVIHEIVSILKDNPNHQIEIEYTWSDVSPAFIPEAKKRIKKIINESGIKNTSLDIIYSSLSIEENFVEKKLLKPSFYDFIIMSNVLHVAKDLRMAVENLIQILTPNGHLVIVEPPYKSTLNDTIVGSFEQWWTFTDIDLRKDRCNLSQENWFKLLKDFNFAEIEMTPEDLFVGSVIQAQKQTIYDESLNQQSLQQYYDNIIFFGSNNNFINNLNSTLYNTIQINNIKEFDVLINDSKVTDNSIIYFIKTIDQLSLNNFKEITFEYIEINKKLLKTKSKCKNVLITCESRNNNYLASSVLGAARYFDEYQQLQLHTIEFDKQSIQGIKNLPNFIESLMKNSVIHKEIIVNNFKPYYNIEKKNIKLRGSFKSESFESADNMICSLSPNLDYQLKSKPIKLEDDQVEVKISATGINYKDYLIYSGLSTDLQNGATDNIPKFGLEFSGIITRVGNNVKGYNIGDEVFGSTNNSASSHTVVDYNKIHLKPRNISHVEAASIPVVYISSFYSLFYVGDFNIEQNESILIHSASGGIGLSALEILKWKGHKSFVFVTVGSDEKKQYLIDKYGDFITGIYSTRDKSYVNNIQKKLIELGSTKNGVDLIINTLSSDYMDANFKLLTTKGRIVDLSITHLNQSEYLKNTNFKFNKGYHNFELTTVNRYTMNNCLSMISDAIENHQLKLIPISSFSNSNIKDAIEYMNERKHIGKIVVNHDQDILSKLMKNRLHQNDYTILKENYQIKSDYLGKNILVTGQSGIILEILKWIVKYSTGTENIIIMSKSSMKWELEFLINKSKLIDRKNIKFHFKSIDISKYDSVGNAISEILNENKEISNIDSIFHFAFTQTACKVDDISMEHLDISHGAKSMGAINLHNLSIEHNWKLMNFVTSSSIASIVGSTDQCSYVCANSILDSFSRYRHSLGLASTCINLGSIQSTGFVSKNESISALLDGVGFIPTPINKVLGLLDLQIQNPNKFTNSMVSSFDLKKFRNNEQTSLISKFDYYLNLQNNSSSKKKYALAHESNIEKLFIKKVSELFSIEESKINQDIRLIDYGADSLVIVQLKNWIDKEIGLNFITIQQLQNNPINTSIQIIISSLNKRSSQNEIKSESIKVESPHSNHSVEFWKNEMKVDDSIFNNIIKTSNDNIDINSNNDEKVIFLTGSTGYLGAYLLFNFIQLEKCKSIYCLLRNKSNSINPLNEIINNLKNHNLHEKLNQTQLSKITPVIGDLSKNEFGLSKDDYKKISTNVNLIINSGADINLKSSYQDCKIVNINGVIEIIKLSLSSAKVNKIPIVNFSSFSVFYNQDVGDNFNESILPSIENIENLPTGYMKSKVVAEYILKEASSKYNISSILIRPPGIFLNPDTGIGHSSDFTLLTIQCCYELGYFPNKVGNENLLLSPVTWVANNSTNLIMNDKCWTNSKMNIYNVHDEPLQSISMVQPLEKYFNCKSVPLDEWIKLVNNSNLQSCIKLKSFHSLDILKFENNQHSINKNQKLSSSTKSLLKSMGSLENHLKITDQMIKNHINHIYKLNK
ncbi:hypothetical protein RB653_009810 [Dictyostelium firmibasis]|uniref:Uncharacterized protein n=1 Tax=Dictyostelium firmibasis TaxID=79012 RepID=A0AAN7TRX6_9MYCE